MKNNKFLFFLAIILTLTIFACSSRKTITKPINVTTKVADVMANLKSKDLYTFINDWLGVKYKFGGLDKKGIDCSGFTLLLQKNIYGRSLPRISRDQANAVKSRSITNLVEGDLVFFAFGGKGVDHVGVYLNNNFFVHASTSRGVIVDDLSLPVYQKAIVKTGTLK